jgi:uncharacterized protein (DUF2147 family)
MRRLIVALLVAFTGSAWAEPLDVAGTWAADSRNGSIRGNIRISDCGDGTPCGALVWFDSSRTDQRLDEHNPAHALRQRSLIGAQLIWGFQRQGQVWRRGWLYNPEDGTTFASTLQLDPDGNRLRVTGCFGPLCQTKIWTRVTTTSGQRA